MNAKITKMQIFDDMKIYLLINNLYFRSYGHILSFFSHKLKLFYVQSKDKGKYLTIQNHLLKLETVCYSRQTYLMQLEFEYLLIMISYYNLVKSFNIFCVIYPVLIYTLFFITLDVPLLYYITSFIFFMSFYVVPVYRPVLVSIVHFSCNFFIKLKAVN